MSALDSLFERKKKSKKPKSTVKESNDSIKEMEIKPVEIKLKTKKEKEKEKKMKLKQEKLAKVQAKASSSSDQESDESDESEKSEKSIKVVAPVIRIKTKKEKEKEKKLKAKLEKQKNRVVDNNSSAESIEYIEPVKPVQQVDIKIKTKKEKMRDKKEKEKLMKKQYKKPVSNTKSLDKIHTMLEKSTLTESEESNLESEESEESVEESKEESIAIPSTSSKSASPPKEEKPKIVYADKKKKKNKPASLDAPAKHASKPVVQSKAVVADEEDWEAFLSDGSESKKSDFIVESPVKTVKVVESKPIIDNAPKSHLRSPICVILGHVDTGKTKLLDNIRQTNVQGQEHGGITQQIGATYMPIEGIRKRTNVLKIKETFEYLIPGLLVIDTPGHESFSNLRSRGSSLCNIAILVVDIMHGLEPQTIESLNLLKSRKTPFIVALNKIDRLYGFEAPKNSGLADALKLQKPEVMRIYNNKIDEMILLFAEQGFNAELYYKNKNLSKYISLCPTSAFTGVGVPDLLQLLIHLTQSRMAAKLTYIDKIECTVLEVKVVEGLGTCLDVILVNGIIKEGDTIVVCGMNGPIVTQIRALLTPQPMKEMRVKSTYVNHKEVKAAMGVRICAEHLEHCIAGCRVLKSNGNDLEQLKEDAMDDFQSMDQFLNKEKGVHVQASTLGSLEALLTFLKDMDIPVFSISIGPIHKKDVLKASVMADHHPEYAVMLCFDVKADKEILEMAKENNVIVFLADIIYHLFDKFKAHHQDMLERKRQEHAPKAVFPCVLKIVAAFNKRDPIVLGVDVVEGSLRVGTPLGIMLDVFYTYIGRAI